MQAWERELEWIKNAEPVKTKESQEENWLKYSESGSVSDEKLFRSWDSFVPGSLAPCHLVVGAIQSMYNKGYCVEEAEKLIDEGLEYSKNKDAANLQVVTAKIYNILNNAPKNILSDYWEYAEYRNWEEIKKNTSFPEYEIVNVHTEEFFNKIYVGWIAQLIGGALGTQIEGYRAEKIKKVFGEIRGYTRTPETYNDDITYELAFLDAFCEKGYNVGPYDIAFKWLALIPEGYSAEETAIKNLRSGIFPPESGTTNNYFSDWIGAQMRTAIHGMVAPGNPELAAKLAVYDGMISHSNSGILGGMFNAVLISMCFVEEDIRKIVEITLNTIPKDSQYYNVGLECLDSCKKYSSWEECWHSCESRLEKYHWIHSYPNLAAEIVALWYGNGDFDETAFIISMVGQDVDCTAAPVLNAIAIIKGIEHISDKWIAPLGKEVQTYMRKYEETTITDIVNKTVDGIRNANKAT